MEKKNVETVLKREIRYSAIIAKRNCFNFEFEPSKHFF